MRLVGDYEQEIDAIWPQIVEAFAFYGRKLREKPSPARKALLRKRLEDGFSPEELLQAVDGYVRVHEGLEREFGNGLTSGHYLRPETVFKADSMDDRVERGLEGRWVYVDPHTAHEQRVKQRQAAARERVRVAREAQQS